MLKRRRNTLLGVILVCSVVTFIFSGCGLLPKEDDTLAPPLIEPKKQEYELYEVKRGDIVSSLKGNGYFVASDEKSVFTKENGRRIESIKVKYGDHVEKGQVLVELDSGDLNNSIKIQQQVFRKAKVNLERSKKDGDSYNIELADADYIIEKTKLESLQNELSKLKLVSPISGTITEVQNFKEGDIVEPYKAIVTVADANSLKVTYTTSEASKIKNGMKVDLSFNGQKYEGKVIQLATGDKDAGNKVLIDMESFPKGAKAGDIMDLSITLESKSNTIVVPKRAVKSFKGTNTVEVMDGNKKILLNVNIGIEAVGEVEIVSGLKEGQKVILN